MSLPSDVFYTFSARQRLQQISAQRAQSLADLEQAKASSDYESAASAVQQIANLESEKANLVALHQQYVASQTPPAPVELTPEQRAAKPAEQMDLSDGSEICRNSKYGADLDFSDPNVIAGCHHMMGGPRARGE